MNCKTISNNQNEDIVGKEENSKRKNNSFNEKNISLDEYNLYSKDLNKPLVLNENQEEQKIEKTDKKNEFINEMKNEIDENNKIKNDQYYKDDLEKDLETIKHENKYELDNGIIDQIKNEKIENILEVSPKNKKI